MEKDNPDWQLESLVRSAFLRTKERFLSYFLATILSWGIYLAYIFIVLVALGFGALLFKIFSILGAIVIAAIVLVALTGFIYISSWVRLAVVSVLINDTDFGVVENYKKVRSRVWGYVGFLFLSSLFTLGLIPISLVSFFIPLILWSIWSLFTVFIYLQERRGGLYSLYYLWASRELVSRKFWGILGRVFLVGGAIVFLQILFSSRDNFFSSIAVIVLSIFTAPFLTSFYFEMYKNLGGVGEVKAPRPWVIVSVIGLILMLVVIFGVMVFGAFTAINLINTGTLPGNFPIPIPTFAPVRGKYY